MNDFREKKNARLIMAIHGIQNEGGANWEERLIDALIHHAEFYVPMRTVGEGEEKKPVFAVVEDKDKNHFYALFTSQEKVKKWPNSTEGSAVLSFHQLALMALDDPRISGFVIDMNSENFILWRKFIANCIHVEQAELMGEVPVRPGEDLEFTEPLGDAKELEEALSEYMRDDLNVMAAYLLGAKQDGKSFNLCIVSHKGSIQPSFANITTVGNDFSGGILFAVMSNRSKTAEDAIKDRMPFYRRPFVV